MRIGVVIARPTSPCGCHATSCLSGCERHPDTESEAGPRVLPCPKCRTLTTLFLPPSLLPARGVPASDGHTPLERSCHRLPRRGGKAHWTAERPREGLPGRPPWGFPGPSQLPLTPPTPWWAQQAAFLSSRGPPPPVLSYTSSFPRMAME